MNIQKNHIHGMVITVLLYLIFLVSFFMPLVRDINNVYLSTSGDGIKNYYTFAYHVKYDTSYSHFNGMNYPYGDHVVFTDNQPVVANLVRFLSKNVYDVSDYTTGIINGLLLFYLFLSSVFLYLLLIRFGAGPYFSPFLAVGITFLSPQLRSFAEHYPLACTCAIPMGWYAIMRFFEKRTLVKSLAIFAIVLFLSLMHLYFLPILLCFIILLWLFQGLSVWRNQKVWRTISHLLIQVLLPVLCIQLWFVLTDSVADRPQSPYGFLAYAASWEAVFLPIGMPLEGFLRKFISFKEVEQNARLLYLGTFSILMAFPIVIARMKCLVKGRMHEVWKVTNSMPLNRSFWAAWIILLLATGMPFIFGLEYLVDYLGPFRQFRSLARLGWVFYYVYNVLVFCFVYTRVKKLTGIIRIGGMVAAVLFLYVDVYQYHTYAKLYEINRLPPLADKRNRTPSTAWLSQVPQDKYQAIVPLPYYTIGSANFNWQNQEYDILRQSIIGSLKTGLPLTGAWISRASFGQTWKQIQLFTEPYREYELLEDLDSDKPFLLWVVEEGLSEWDKNLIAHSNFVYEFENNKLYELKLDSIQVLPAEMAERASREYEENGIINGMRKDTVLCSYDELNSSKSYRGGSYCMPGTGRLIFYENVPVNITPGKCILSFWMYLREDRYPTLRFFYEQQDKRGNIIDQKMVRCRELLQVMDGQWALLEYEFEYKNSDNKVILGIDKDRFKKPVYVDELLIRPIGVNVYRKGSDYIFKNNRYYPIGLCK